MFKNKKIKGVIICILLITMLVLLVGCGNQENQGESKSSENNTSSSSVKIGDYVAYNAGTGNTYTAKAESTGYDKDQIFETTGEEKWRVLSIEDDGTINLVSAEPITTKFEKGFYIQDKEGFDNYVKELNSISEIYGKGEFAQSARSMKMEDINQYLDVDEVGRYYQNKYEVDLSGYTGEDKWNEIYKLMNEDYGKEYTLNGSTRKINFAFDWYSREDADFRDFIKDQNVLDVLNVKSSDRILLANEIVKLAKYAQEPDYFILCSPFYQMSDFSRTYKCDTLYHEKSKDEADKIHYKALESYIRPVVTLKSDVKIGEGTGTAEEPYVLK